MTEFKDSREEMNDPGKKNDVDKSRSLEREWHLWKIEYNLIILMLRAESGEWQCGMSLDK